MELFEKFNHQIDKALKDLTRMQLRKKLRLDDNFLTPPPETVNEVFQTRALIATAKRGTERSSYRNHLNNSVDNKTPKPAGVLTPNLMSLD